MSDVARGLSVLCFKRKKLVCTKGNETPVYLAIIKVIKITEKKSKVTERDKRWLPLEGEQVSVRH